MKKAILIIMAISFTLVMSGFIIVAACGFKPFSAISINEYSLKRDLLASPVTAEQIADVSTCKQVTLNLVNADLEVIKYDGKDIKIDYQSNYKDEWMYSFNNGVLKLENKRYNEWHNNFESIAKFLQNLKDGNFNLNLNIADFTNEIIKTSAIKLYIPADAQKTFNISAVNGSVNLSGIGAADITLVSVNCGITLSDVVSTGGVTVTDINGRVSLKNLKVPQLIFKNVVNADVTIEAPQIDFIDAKTIVNGTLTINDVKNIADYNINVKSIINGSVLVDNKKFSQSSSGNGKYKIYFSGVNTNFYLNS